MTDSPPPPRRRTHVLLPVPTIEDFPTRTDDVTARSLLAAVTGSMHPSVIVADEHPPTIGRADAPPDPAADLSVWVPLSSEPKLPAGYADEVRQAGGLVVTGTDRASMVAAAGCVDPPPIRHDGRYIGVDDFYAAAFVWLQIQIMTRRLRYSSNLDDVFVHRRFRDAATALFAFDARGAADALHDVFDALAAERDHYFSSDPHLVRLMLVGASTIDAAAESIRQTENDSSIDPVPQNLLLDTAAITQLASADQSSTPDNSARSNLVRHLRQSKYGWAAGGPDEMADLSAMTITDASDALIATHRLAQTAIGSPPPVYGRLAGATPGDLLGTLIGLGYKGIIPIDFATGGGIGEESKVWMQSDFGVPVIPAAADNLIDEAATDDAVADNAATDDAATDSTGDPANGDDPDHGDNRTVDLRTDNQTDNDGEVQAIQSTPIDAFSDASFLDLLARLGEAIDRGEVATGLLVHWPGRVCDSMRDLLRASTWSLACGRFWKLDEYFSEGERPYHHGHIDVIASDFDDRLRGAFTDPASIDNTAKRFRDSMNGRHDRVGMAMVALVHRKLAAKPSSSPDTDRGDLATAIAAATGAIPSDDNDAVLIFNPTANGRRVPVEISRRCSSEPKHIFGVSEGPRGANVTADVPAGGFVTVRGQNDPRPSTRSWLRNVPGIGSLVNRRGGIVRETGMLNEFMEVTLSDSTGSLAGIYSGSGRGNRLSMRLDVGGSIRPTGDVSPADNAADKASDKPVAMVCDHWETIVDSSALGHRRAVGRIRGDDGRDVAEFELNYRLHRGSRTLRVEGKLARTSGVTIGNGSGGDAWTDMPVAELMSNCIVARIATAEENTPARYWIRDRWHHHSGRRIVAPGGYMLDGSERRTLVATGGHAMHHRRGTRFIDTVLATSQQTVEFKFAIVVDPPKPAAAMIESIVPPVTTSIRSHASLTQIGYLCQVSGGDVIIADMHTTMIDDDHCQVRLSLVQTTGKSTRVTVRFCREVLSIERGDAVIRDDAVVVSLGAHQWCEIDVRLGS